MVKQSPQDVFRSSAHNRHRAEVFVGRHLIMAIRGEGKDKAWKSAEARETYTVEDANFSYGI